MFFLRRPDSRGRFHQTFFLVNNNNFYSFFLTHDWFNNHLKHLGRTRLGVLIRPVWLWHHFHLVYQWRGLIPQPFNPEQFSLPTRPQLLLCLTKWHQWMALRKNAQFQAKMFSRYSNSYAICQKKNFIVNVKKSCGEILIKSIPSPWMAETDQVRLLSDVLGLCLG